MPSSYTLSGFLYNNAGVAVSGATVNTFARNTVTGALSTTTTDTSGYWALSPGSAQANMLQVDVQLTNAATGAVRRIKYDDVTSQSAVITRNLHLSPDSNQAGASAGFFTTLTATALQGDSHTVTFPDATGTAALLSFAQTWTALQTFSSLKLATGATVTGILDEDAMGTNSDTQLATQQSIKAYVDAQVATADTLSEVLALGNTSGSTSLVIDSGQVLTTNTINETTATSGVTIDSVLLKDNTVTATTFTGALTGNVTGNASGTAATVTSDTQAAIITLTNVVTVGELVNGSIADGFGTINNGSNTITTTGLVTAGALTVNGTTTLNGALVLGDAAADTLTINATLQGATPLVFEGANVGGDNLHETSFAIVDPTADRTITFPDATLTVNAAANISGATLASNVVTSSLTTVGELGTGSIGAGFGIINNAAAITGTVLTGTTSGVFASDMTITSGSVISASGAITFDNENLSTTGTLAAGALTLSGALISSTDGTLDIGTDAAPFQKAYLQELQIEQLSGNAAIVMNAETAGTDPYIIFQEASANKWAFYHDSSADLFGIYNYTQSTYPLTFSDVNDDLSLTATGKLRLDYDFSGNSYIHEASADVVEIVSGGAAVQFSTGNVTLADGKVINLGEAGKIDFGDEAPADNAATGIVFSFLAGATLAIGDVVYMGTDGEVLKADANQATTMPAIGICVGAGTDGNAVDVLVQGIMHDTSAFDTFTVGADVFVSAAATGAIVAAAPSGSGDTVQKVGVALHADMVYFNFNTTEVLLA